MVAALLQAHARVNVHSAAGDTPLMMAASLGSGDTVRMVLQHAPDINAQNQDGDTALIAASRAGNTAAVKVLLAGGASTALRNGKRATAADVARDRGFGSLAAELGGKS
jgi:ankyrin repeat protein